MPPFVGITGAASPTQVRQLIHHFHSHGLTEDAHGLHVGAIGFSTDESILRPEMALKTPRNLRDLDQLASCLKEIKEESVRCVVHFEPNPTRSNLQDILTIFDSLKQRQLYSTCHTVQLNADCTPEEVAFLKLSLPDLGIVYQVRPELTGQGLEAVRSRVALLKDDVEVFLIDSSLGRGIPFDKQTAMQVFGVIREVAPEVNVGFAGGFRVDNALDRIKWLVENSQIGEFSVDVESGVQSADGMLDMEKCAMFLEQVKLGFS